MITWSLLSSLQKSRGSSASGSPERTALADAERGARLVVQRGAWATMNPLADAAKMRDVSIFSILRALLFRRSMTMKM